MTLQRKGRRVCFYLELENDTALDTLVKMKGGRSKGTSKSAEINVAIAEYIARNLHGGHSSPLRETIEEAIRERMDQQEAWLRPMLANAGINATAALLASVEVICGTRLGKDRVREFVDLLRGRAWQLYRRPVKDESPGES